jgi:Glycosyl transferases group 1
MEGRALERLYEWERRLYGDALHVFTLGSSAARSVVDFYGVPQERVTVVGGGASFDVLPDPPDGPREPIVLYMGSDWRRKGGDVLIDAFRRVRSEHPDARLQIVGTEEPATDDGVEVLGFLRDRDRLADLYARASIGRVSAAASAAAVSARRTRVPAGAAISAGTTASAAHCLVASAAPSLSPPSSQRRRPDAITAPTVSAAASTSSGWPQ